MISQTDANEETTTYVRNALGEPVEVIDPLSRKTIEEFDPAGNLETVIDPKARETTYSYDPANRLTEVDYSEGATPDVQLEYNPDGNVTSMIDGTGESRFEYDQLGRLTESEDGHDDVVGYEYDLAEEPIGLTYPNGESISREFDEAGRLESVTDWLGHTTTFSYDPDSNLEAIAFPGGAGNVDEYTYDQTDHMSEAKFAKGALASLSYIREKVGQVEEEVRKGLPGPEKTLYGYDENNRLTSAGAANYEYDPADNLTKAPGTTNKYDPAGQLETGTGLSYTYDELGERTKATPSSGPATSYEYDQAGNLISIERPAEGAVPAIEESLAYDGSGLLTSKTSGLTTQHLSWDSSSPLPLLLNDGQNSYVYGPSGVAVEQISSEEAPTFLHHDQIGSTRLLTNTSGEATASFSYLPYGGLEGHTGSATTPLGFAGQYTDAQSGLQYLRARFYDPGTAQFLTSDPLALTTQEPYTYALDAPLSIVDPSGEFGVDEVAAGGGAICAGTLEVPGVDVGTCGGAAAAAAAAAGAATANSIYESLSTPDEKFGGLTLSKGLAARFAEANSDDERTCPSDTPNFDDPSQSPGPGWEWRGNGPPGSSEGSWYNPGTGESLHPDLGHGGDIKPHYDYLPKRNGPGFRVYPGGRSVPKRG